jgi:hypothetical protein
LEHLALAGRFIRPGAEPARRCAWRPTASLRAGFNIPVAPFQIIVEDGRSASTFVISLERAPDVGQKIELPHALRSSSAR